MLARNVVAHAEKCAGLNMGFWVNNTVFLCRGSVFVDRKKQGSFRGPFALARCVKWGYVPL